MGQRRKPKLRGFEEMTLIRGEHDTPTGFDFTQDKALRPAKAIRAQCLHCTCDMPSEIRTCTASAHPTAAGGCHLWPFRFGSSRDLSKGHPRMTRGKAMRKECLRCMGGSNEGVRECVSTYCPLWPYRHGKGVEDVNGHRQRETSAEVRASATARLASARAKQAGAIYTSDFSPETTNGTPAMV